MLTKKDKIGYFKRECKNMHYYKEMVKQCNEKLEELANEILGVSSPAAKDVVLENASDPYKSNKLYLIVEEEMTMKERDDYQAKIDYINSKLKEIKNPVGYAMVTELLVERTNLNKIAYKYHMDRSTVWRTINRILSKIL